MDYFVGRVPLEAMIDLKYGLEKYEKLIGGIVPVHVV